MKILKIFVFASALFTMASCADYDSTPDKPDTNTAGGVTIEMSQTQISFLESKGVVRVPVTVKGKANGYIVATCKVDEVAESPAMEDYHYYLTSPTIYIAPGDSTGYFEVRLRDNREINPARLFTITLADVSGATIGAPNNTIVTIDDNDDKPYDRLDGTWYVPTSASQYKQLTLSSYTPDDPAYGYSYRLVGMFGENTLDETNSGYYPINVFFNYNETTEEGSLRIPLYQTIGHYNLQGQQQPIRLVGLMGNNLYAQGDITLTWNSDQTELYIVSSPMGSSFYFSAMVYDGNSALGSPFNTVENVTTLYRSIPN